VSVRVGVYRGLQDGYSEEWRTENEFPEKQALRELSRILGFDEGNLLSGVVRPGQNVVVKPNWVLDHHPRGYDNFAVITHSAVLRAVVDLAYEAMSGEGTITIADAPQWNCDFANLLRVTEVERIPAYYAERHGFEIGLVDLRLVGTVAAGFITRADRVELAGDPAGYAIVDLGRESAFVDMPHIERIYGADYDRAETREHHNAELHEYLISKTILRADTVIHVPKLKVHKRVGVTLNAKGMVGINGHKNWIAHYRIGPPAAGGDEYPDDLPVASHTRNRVMRLVTDHLLAPQSKAREHVFTALRRGYRIAKPILGPLRFPEREDELPEGGNWYGNDTAWRMTADLARAVLFADDEGRVRDTVQRQFVSVVDGIVAGEREGPLAASPKPCGVLVAGNSLLGVDLVCTRLMDFDWRKIRSLRWLVEDSPHDMGVGDPSTIEVLSNVAAWEQLLVDSSVPGLGFEPHPRWVGHVELDRALPVPASREVDR
jgi:uncharacterized protein (DUF362 family)